jgi:outer membrane protein assembly factor BamA
MTLIRTLTLLAASLACLSAQSPVPTSAEIEAIRFEGIPAAEHKQILNRIDVRTGDTLSTETRRRIGRRLNQNLPAGVEGYTFTYRPGSRPGTAILLLNKGC